MLARHSPTSLAFAVDAPDALQRSEGEAEVAFCRKDGVSRVARLYQRAPCRVLFPAVAEGDHPEAVLVTTSGGITGGDRLDVTVSVDREAAALVTTQAAEKVYRSLGPRARSAVSLKVAAGAWLEWLPQETILFDGARLDRRLEAVVAADGRLVASEMITFGRIARGERFAKGLLLDRWRVRRADRLIWADALRLDADCAGLLDDRLGFSGARAMATVVYVAADALNRLELARSLTANAGGWAGATLINGMLLARFLAKDPIRLRVELARYLAKLRHAAAGLPAQPPRMWRC
jgi:urease accessory protein